LAKAENMVTPGYGLEDRLTAGGGEITKYYYSEFKTGSY
jgi:hypothetical protein